MTEPTITCPNCKTEIKLTESLAAPLIESIRRGYGRNAAAANACSSWRSCGTGRAAMCVGRSMR